MLGVFRQVVARDHADRKAERGGGVGGVPPIRREAYIAALAAISIALNLLLRYVADAGPWAFNAPLLVALAVGGVPLIIGLSKRILVLEFGSDLLAGASIVTAVLMGEYLVGAIVVLMLS